MRSYLRDQFKITIQIDRQNRLYNKDYIKKQRGHYNNDNQINPTRRYNNTVSPFIQIFKLQTFKDASVHSNVQSREQAPPVAKVMRKEARHTQRRDRASGVPLEILEHLSPKPESAYFLLCAFTYTSDFTGGCPPLPLSEKRVSLQLQLIIPGCDSV